MNKQEIRRELLTEIQSWIDANNIYQVEFGHYDNSPPHSYGGWVPLKTKRINVKEIFNAENNK